MTLAREFTTLARKIENCSSALSACFYALRRIPRVDTTIREELIDSDIS
jgi:hypothetical protein